MPLRVLAFIAAMAATPAIAEPMFENQAERLGISHQHTGDWEHFAGGGNAALMHFGLGGWRGVKAAHDRPGWDRVGLDRHAGEPDRADRF